MGQITAWLKYIRSPTRISVHCSPTHLVDIRSKILYEKGSYRMELSIFSHNMLRGLGTNRVPEREYQGFAHINNIVDLLPRQRFFVDVGIGGDGPASLKCARERLEFVSHFAELGSFQHDFEVLNRWTAPKTLHRWTLLVVQRRLNVRVKTYIVYSLDSEAGTAGPQRLFRHLSLAEGESQSIRGWDTALD
ncbi:hypothetical protein BDW62DRAFT_213971 [Aspergillus aurantiobrunneus]